MHGIRHSIHPGIGTEISCAPAATFALVVVAGPPHSAGCPNKVISATTANAAASYQVEK
jgi:hypothetical protein